MCSFVGTFRIMHEYLVVVWREGVPCFHVWERLDQKPVLVYMYPGLAGQSKWFSTQVHGSPCIGKTIQVMCIRLYLM